MALQCTVSISPQKWRMISTVWGCSALIWNQGELSRGFMIHMLMFMKSRWPMRPSSIHFFARRAAGVKRWFMLIP